MPKKESINNEIKYSISTILVFSCVFYLMYYLRQQGYSKTYIELDKYGFAYLILSFPMLLLIHDFYFYCIHRLMHHPKLFKHVHAVHHRSHNPTPFAAFSFHPIEAFELYGKNFLKTFLGKVINTSTHHNMHHKYANCNYGLYSIIWDKLFKSNHKKYEETFELIAGNH